VKKEGWGNGSGTEEEEWKSSCNEVKGGRQVRGKGERGGNE